MRRVAGLLALLAVAVLVTGCATNEKPEATKAQAEASFRAKFIAALDARTVSEGEAESARAQAGIPRRAETASRSHIVIGCYHENEWHCEGTAYAVPRSNPVQAAICFLLDGGGYTDGNDRGFSAGPPGKFSGKEMNPPASRCEEHRPGATG
jgi:hypothetical protein